MNLAIDFLRSARAEFDSAADWYEERQTGLGPEFTAAVQRVLDRIVSQPDFYPPVWDDIREALIRGFPYCVYYREVPEQVLVLAVFHTSRNPAIWQRRD
ncbi:MAG: type II toxin-antitoxin system RelE/ParE family toxin [Planctomycetaceae bacterium]